MQKCCRKSHFLIWRRGNWMLENSKALCAYSIKKNTFLLRSAQSKTLPRPPESCRPPATRSLSAPVSCFQNKSSGEREPRITETQSAHEPHFVFTDSQFILLMLQPVGLMLCAWWRALDTNAPQARWPLQVRQTGSPQEKVRSTRLRTVPVSSLMENFPTNKNKSMAVQTALIPSTAFQPVPLKVIRGYK